MESTPIRIYLSGRISIEAGEQVLGPEEFPGHQGRAAFAYLAIERSRPVSRAELAEALWPGPLPPSWDGALSAVLSKLRSLLVRAGLDGRAALGSAGGCYDLRLPPSSWIDLEAASDAIHHAESALRAGDPASAYGPSAVAHHIARRSFLPGDESPWVERRREKLRSVLVRALECRGEVYLWNREHALAVEAARDAVELSPFRESAHRLLMRAHAGAGNAAEAMWAYERCRCLLSEELGVDPSPETRAVRAELLASL